jgi:diguanylate cyclase (GGDEF)-like protein
MSLVRLGRRFDAGEQRLLGELGTQVARALENVERHNVVSRAAVTDKLTGLANRGQFGEMLVAALEQARRYHHPVSLIMLDVDNFKRVNDTFGHPQGDQVLRQVAQAVRANSRDADTPARYGGEEMALILPHTDLDGAFEVAERTRSAIAALKIPLLEGEDETICVTTSVGAAASADADKNELIAAADGALYVAKREGKNRTIRAERQTVNVVGGE